MQIIHAMLSGARGRRVMLAGTLLLVAACTKPAPADAYGNFEAEEVVVGGEVAGQLTAFAPVEGRELAAGAVVAQVDTVPLALERAQLVAQRAGLVARRREGTDQLTALQVQREIATRTRARVERLFAAQAATAMQRDQAERDVRVLAAQLEGGRAAIDRSRADIDALEARIASLSDRLARTTVHNPVGGTVLATYARTGEMVGAGQPLYRIANLDTLTLRAWVTGSQLTSFRLGTRVAVTVGDAGAPESFTGDVTWVSSRAEFTPTPVQTREDRGDLVYAVKVRVAHRDGHLKVGMPADVTLSAAPVAASTPSR
ncbi:MAG: HlyD family efflux transporter periplasmic adaptor subunit [Gemmatimonadaceae bacterium]|nr:HlyD family efflux transporter periplasmic adaptor subunit [Gemmatimonadaceae bacterium]